jgi:NADPH-dependent ferric siderophore reductase
MAIASPLRTERFPLAARLVEVRSVVDLTPRYRRITLGGDELAGFRSLDPDDHFKLAVPAPGRERPALPEFGPEGPSYPEGSERPVLRDYTPRRFEPERNELVVDFALHGDGPATSWAARARPGDLAGVLGPRGSRILDATFDWHLLVGDETALPSIARRLEEAQPGQRFVALVEVDDTVDEQAIETRADLTMTWVHRKGGNDSLLGAVRDLAFPDGTFYTWAGGEANALRDIRRHLVNERGIDPSLASFSGHWKRGVANHDHHEPIED